MLTIILIWCRHALSISVLLSLLCVCVCISKSHRRSSFCQSLLARRCFLAPIVSDKTFSPETSPLSSSRSIPHVRNRLGTCIPLTVRFFTNSFSCLFVSPSMVTTSQFSKVTFSALVAFDQAASDDDIVPTFDDDDRDFSHQRLHVTQQRALSIGIGRREFLSFLFWHLFFSFRLFRIIVLLYWCAVLCAFVFSVVKHFGVLTKRKSVFVTKKNAVSFPRREE